jgi:SWI/SNF-related matrix-associated actin-dependent regulator of chromatin subfamily A3
MSESSIFLDFSSSGNSRIAILNREASEVLLELEEICYFEASSFSQPWTSILNRFTAINNNTVVYVDIILYGQREDCDEVGEILTARKLYLQEPDYWDPALDYHNPHFLDLSGVHLEARAISDSSNSFHLQFDLGFQFQRPEGSAREQTLWKQKISTAFKSMTRAKTLKRIAADTRICTPLLPYVHIVSEL